jgi:putative hydrolase of the HAD superfamily
MNGRRRGGSLRIQAVSFDVGGTLIEPWPSVGEVYAQVAAEHGFSGLPAEVLNRQFAAAWKACRDFAHTRAQWSALVDETFRGLVPTPPSRSFFPAVYARFDEPGAWRIYDDVVPTLRALRARGLRLAVISNWDERLRPLLRRLELSAYFELIVVSCEVGEGKPSPRIFAAAAAGLALPPAAILHVGDSLEQDARGARGAGMAARHLRRGEAGEEGQAHEINSLYLLEDILVISNS